MPSIHTLVKFLHISSDIGLFIGIGVQLLTLAALRRAKNTEQARPLIGLINMSEPLSIISGLLLLTTGLYMGLMVWNLRIGWIAVSLGSLVVFMPLLIRGVVEPRMQTIVKMAKEAPDGPLPEPLYERIHDPVLGAGLHTTAALVLGIVFLMTTKPALVGSIVVIAIALVLGMVSGLPFQRKAEPSRS